MFWLPTGHDNVTQTVCGALNENTTQKPLFECLTATRGWHYWNGGVTLLDGSESMKVEF